MQICSNLGVETLNETLKNITILSKQNAIQTLRNLEEIMIVIISG